MHAVPAEQNNIFGPCMHSVPAETAKSHVCVCLLYLQDQQASGDAGREHRRQAPRHWAIPGPSYCHESLGESAQLAALEALAVQDK